MPGPSVEDMGSTAASQMQKEHLLWTGTSGHSQACGEEARVCFADVSVMFIINRASGMGEAAFMCTEGHTL